jgi:Holliday junction DNA helicase RuvA
MIALLRGKIAEKEERGVILDVQGVGYRVATFASLHEKMHEGDDVVLRIFHHITSDSEALFGFATKEDLHFFELLLTVPSVGPKTAMNILNVAPPETLSQAVAANDMKLLTHISGVGKKTAERIMVELKGKVLAKEFTSGMSGDIQNDVVQALVSIGYTNAQARQSLQKLPKDIGSVEEAVRAVLQNKS